MLCYAMRVRLSDSYVYTPFFFDLELGASVCVNAS